MAPSWESQRQAVDELKTEISKMEDEVADYRRNKDYIIAQSKAAQVKKDIYEAKARISKKSSPDDLMARLKEKAERSGYEAEAAKEMAEAGGDSLEKEFESLCGTAADPAVADKLAALKAKMSGGATSS